MNNIEFDYTKIPETLLNKIICIYLYGSHSRGDNDEYSDCDIFICISDCLDNEYYELTKELNSIFNSEYELSVYKISKIRQMQVKGSYFLWHLKKEGRLIYQSDNCVSTILENLPLYKHTYEDFAEYAIILEDIKQSLEEDCIPIYELSLLASLARNICIGICYLKGIMDFGRVSPVIRCLQIFKEKFPFTLSQYNKLYSYRICYVRGVPIKYDITLSYVFDWCNKIKVLLNLAMNIRSENVSKQAKN